MKQDNKSEIWLPIVGYEGLYEISNLGRVKSLPKKYINKLTGGYAVKKERILSDKKFTSGDYIYCTLYNSNKGVKIKVNEIVASHFLGEKNNDDDVIIHINGVRTDNRLCNLRYGNAEDSVFHYKKYLNSKDTDETNEVWCAVKGFEGFYEVSTFGRVRSVGRRKKTRLIGTYFRKEHILNIKPNRFGYCRFLLYKDGCKKNAGSVHRLVAEAFIPNIDNKPFVNHKNGVKHDNRVENLEWCTASENSLHSFRVLGRKSINNHLVEKLSVKVKCETLGINFSSYGEAARELGLKPHQISKSLKKGIGIVDGLSFRYL